MGIDAHSREAEGSADRRAIGYMERHRLANRDLDDHIANRTFRHTKSTRGTASDVSTQIAQGTHRITAEPLAAGMNTFHRAFLIARWAV